MTPDQEQAINAWRESFGHRLDDFEERLKENTQTTKRVEENTSELVNILNSWKGAMKVIEFLGRLAKPVTALVAMVAAVLAWRHTK